MQSIPLLKETLDTLHDRYNRPEFIAEDPVSIPHRFFVPGAELQPRAADVEIAGFLAATIAWGNRKAIVKSAGRMMDVMDGAPHDFVMNASAGELDRALGYVHRTFNGGDLRSFLLSLRHIYSKFGTMGAYFEREFAISTLGAVDSRGSSRANYTPSYTECSLAQLNTPCAADSTDSPISGDLRRAISRFRSEFFTPPHAPRCEKHLSSIDRGAACKRTNMFLRWMIRRDDRGVDFGLWRSIPPAALYLPLDVHSAAVSRSLGLLSRRQNDWRAVEEVTANLRLLDPLDPVKYDFALFGAGIDGYMKR
ncbi:MAG: TIGR02757 family protein [Alistipes sp.]|jgi:uncharacterized protein (TIGR02757 family)|nr:TIGR02757 family protein [Alistipes sp.]